MDKIVETAAWVWLRKRLAVIKRVGYHFKATLRPMSLGPGRFTFEIVLYSPPGGKYFSISSCYPDWFDISLARESFEHQFSQVRE